jgi:transcriptional regulator with XRE-family HTH domain
VGYAKHQKFISALGQRVRELRLAKGLSQEDLANACGFEISQISRIELGKINTSVSHVVYICEALKVPVSELMNFSYSNTT